jgi:hypothetical protein
MNKLNINKLYHRLVVRHADRVSFVILIYFLAIFIAARFYVFVGKELEALPTYRLLINGIHIHHFNYGILFLVASGYLALIFKNSSDKIRLKLAALYGVGLGFTFDEFGMWLKLENDYWMRTSYDAIVIISLMLISVIYFPNGWRRVAKDLEKCADKIKEIKKLKK